MLWFAYSLPNECMSSANTLSLQGSG